MIRKKESHDYHTIFTYDLSQALEWNISENNRTQLKKSKYTMNRSKLLSFLTEYLKCH